MKTRDLHPRLLYPAKLSFRMGGQIKSFPDKVKLRDFIITKPLLYEIQTSVIRTTIKLQKIYIYQQLNLKNKLSKQEEQGQNHGHG